VFLLGKTRKKRKKPLSSNLKFELYGILLLIFSVITLAREGSVGKSIAFLFRVLVGNLEPVLSLLLIFIAVYHFMIRRSWPTGWTVKNTGIMLFLLGLMVSLHNGLFQTLMPNGGYTASWIVSQTWEVLRSHFTGGGLQFTADAGGGMIGGFAFAALYVLFGNVGAKLIEFTLYAIGLLLFTGWSYIQIISSIRKFIAKVLDRLGASTKETLQLLHAKNGAVSANGQTAVIKRKAVRSEARVELDEEFDEESWKPDKPAKKTWFHKLSGFGSGKVDNSQEAGQALSEADGYVQEAEASSETVVYKSDAVRDIADSTPLRSRTAPQREERHEPVFVDFLDQVRESVQRTAGIPIVEGQIELPLDEQELAAPRPMNGMEAAASEQTVAAVLLTMTPPAPPVKPYVLPPFHLLSRPGAGKGSESADTLARENARKLETTMESFGVRAKVLQVVRGPAVTRYEIQPDIGVKVSRIVGLTDDIALALAAKDIRMEAPIPGKSAIGIEVPNTEVSIVSLREVMETSAFHESDAKLTIALGRDISGQPIVANLAKMPHLLVAGATGSGKSVCINGIITSVLYKAKPDEVKFLMIDPKMVELNVYNGIPHLLAPVVTDPRRASLALKKIVVEMEKRYEAFSKSATRNIEGYNAQLVEKGETPLPYIVVIVDELADLMMVAAGDVEDAITRLAQMARAAGIHLIIATQRPSVDVITGVIKANIPSRIAFGVSSQVDSRTILDMAGAEKLLGRGDMLFVPVGASKAVRVQGAFLSDNEVEAVVTFCRDQEKAQYREELVPEIQDTGDDDNNHLDDLFEQAVGIVVEAKQASVSLLQRRMRIGYTRAARLIDQMEAKGVVGPYEGSKPREVLMSYEQLQIGRVGS
jgi:S-DNA-T family DNA segregation ATPase FtsK/SpoIIIE